MMNFGQINLACIMANQRNLDDVYMGVAKLHASLSKATRMHVGACMVLKTGIIIPGVNGLPKALGNECEHRVMGNDGVWGTTTKAEVIHAEEACILKAAKEGVSAENSTVYITHPPCRHCASMLISVGVRRLVYDNTYRDLTGLDLLREANVIVHKFGEHQYD